MALYKIVENDKDYIYLKTRHSTRRRLRLNDFKFEKAYLRKGVTSHWMQLTPSHIDIEEILQIVRSRLS